MFECFLVFHRLTRKHLALLMDVVSRLKSFSEAPQLAWKCGTHGGCGAHTVGHAQRVLWHGGGRRSTWRATAVLATPVTDRGEEVHGEDPCPTARPLGNILGSSSL
jgi:hypothetical protein